MTDTKTVNLAGVVVANGTAKFHTSGPQKSDAQFYKLPIPLAPKADVAMGGSFAFFLLPSAMTKVDAAKHLLTKPEFMGEVFKTCLQAVIFKNIPKVKAPKAEKVAKKAESKKVATKALKDAVAPEVKPAGTGAKTLSSEGLAKMRAGLEAINAKKVAARK